MPNFESIDTSLTRQLLSELLGDFPRRDFTVRLWDGSHWPDPTSDITPAFTLVLNHPGSLRTMFGSASPLSMGEAFLGGAFDVEGDILVACELGDYLMRLQLGALAKLKLAIKLRTLPAMTASNGGRKRANLSGRIGSRQRMREAIAYHYDLPAEFWSSWLDSTLAYSCAYFKEPSDSLDQAQLNKLDYVCRKLYLKQGERLLDLGCGWGGLVMFAVQNYGVTAKGITLSRKQAEYGNRRIKQLGIEDKCEIDHLDFRDYETTEPYDKIASIGAVEHVPVAELKAFFAHAKRLLKPNGLFLNHGITASGIDKHPKGASFVDEYVFPDNGVTNVSRLLTAAEEGGFEVRDVECLREHYKRTCELWLHRIEKNQLAVAQHSNQSTARLFRLYVAAQTYYFTTGASSIHQMLLANSDSKPLDIPLTRKGWYESLEN
jgi:cyclopropane-fatty-acyl-phospholipid synthase